MDCLVCQHDDLQKQDLVYLNGETGSGEIIFKIVPSLKVAAQNDGRGYIVFGVSSGGIEFDHIPIAVTVGQPVAVSSYSGQVRSKFSVPRQTERL